VSDQSGALIRRATGVILLGMGVFAITDAVDSLVAVSHFSEQGGTELIALSKLGAGIFGVGAVLFLTAGVGVLRGKNWGRVLGLAITGLVGVLGGLALVTSPMPWDHSANLGIYQQSLGDWLLSLIPIGASLFVFIALLRARGFRKRGSEGADKGTGD
jgi:hypothetical protein